MQEGYTSYEKRKQLEVIQEMRMKEKKCIEIAEGLALGRCIDESTYLAFKSLQSYVSIVNVG